MFNVRIILGIVVFLILNHAESVAEHDLPRVITPLPAPKITDLPQFQGQHKESLYWGTYRPQVYLGVRARTPKSLIAGLMWIVVKDRKYHLRHVCKHEDDLSTYGWTKHNGRDFGHQVLVDQGMTLTTEFLKSKEEGSAYGGDWAVRINVQAHKSKWIEEFGKGAHLFFYMADEGANALNLSRENLNILEDSLLASGSHADTGDWQLHLKSMDDLELHYSGFRTPHFHNLSDLVEENLSSQIRKNARLLLSDSSDDSPNVLVFQIIGGFSFTTDVIFISGTRSESSRVEERVSSLSGTSLSNQLKYKEQAFDEKFDKVFNLEEKVDSESISVGKAAVGNLLGGIGYFYGQSKIAVSGITNLGDHVNYISYWPAELYTAVPCRPSFPRGFLWDEGFHQLIIWRWDIHISLDIIGHWLDLMNVDGWIPREQILGDEALSRVPEEYVPQHPTNGNPPTLFLALRGAYDEEPTSVYHEEAAVEEAGGSGIKRVVIEIDDLVVDDEVDDYDVPLTIPPFHNYVKYPSSIVNVNKLYYAVCLRDIPLRSKILKYFLASCTIDSKGGFDLLLLNKKIFHPNQTSMEMLDCGDKYNGKSMPQFTNRSCLELERNMYETGSSTSTTLEECKRYRNMNC